MATQSLQRQGAVIVNQLEQAGALLCMQDSDRLQSDQVSLFTGKKDQAERAPYWVVETLSDKKRLSGRRASFTK